MIRMKLHLYSTCLLVTLMFMLSIQTNALADYKTNLVFYGYIQDSSGDIDVSMYSVPVVYDWNDDGKKDLLVGQRYDHPDEGRRGFVSFYENVECNSAPIFNNSSLIQACSNTCNLSVPGFG